MMKQKEAVEDTALSSMILESLNDAVLVIDKGLVLYGNRALTDLTGYPIEETIGSPFDMYIDPDYRQIAKDNYLKRLSGKIAPERYDIAVITKDNRKIYVEVNASTIKVGDKVLDVVVVRNQDERINYERSLEEKDRFLENIIEQTPNGMWISDTDGNIIKFNTALQKLLCRDEESIVTQNVLQNTQFIEQGLMEKVESVFYKGETASFTMHYDTGKGDIRLPRPTKQLTLAITMSPLRNVDGEITNVICLHKDVTEQTQYIERNQLAFDILDLLNNATDRTEILGRIVSLIKQFAEVNAVGIRLLDNQLFPYRAFEGFSNNFIHAGMLVPENVDPDELPQDCLCNKVLFMNTDSNKPYYTENGSFWTNNLSEILNEFPIDERTILESKSCFKEGFESMALIPVRSLDETIGLLQLADIKTNMFDSDLINYFEHIGMSIGIAFGRSIDQEELQLEKERIEQIYNTAQTIILTLDSNGNILDFNPYFEELSGYNAEELTGKSLFDTFIPASEQEAIKDCFSAYMSGQNCSGTICSLITKNSGIRQIIWNNTVITDENGNVLSLLSTGQDITEQLQLEELYTTVVNHTPIGIYILQNNKFLFTNGEFIKASGYSEEEIRHINPQELIHPDDLSIVRKNAVTMLKKQSATPYEFRIIKKNGEIRWSMETVTSIRFNGKPALLGSFMNITERKQAEQQVRDSEEKLRTTIESIPMGIIVTDLNGQIIQANPSALKLYKCASISEIIGHNALDFASEDSHERIINCIFQAKESVEPLSFTYTGLTRDKEPFSAEMNIAFIRGTDGQPNSIIGIFEDITERLNMQEQLVVTDRLASVGELAAGIAHELNNPLTGVIGFSDLLMMRENLPVDVVEDITSINREALRATQVAKHLLTFARKHPDEKSPVNINDIITLVLELRAYEQRVNNIKVIRNLSPFLPAVMANEFQLQQVFLNIIINAEYFMQQENDGGTLHISTHHDGDVVRAVFQDDGSGISKDHLPNIFNPFYTTKDVGKGTGLGLSICHGIITEHGGKITADSTPGKGSTFTIELTVWDIKKALNKDSLL